jgi:Putative prokaryotic signal transducing protein
VGHFFSFLLPPLAPQCEREFVISGGIDMEEQEPVSVYTVKSPAEAEIVRSALQALGIPCTIGGEIQGGFTGTFEIDILVPAEDADLARKELRLLRKEKKERRKARVEKKKTRKAEKSSEAIQELKPRPPSTDIKRKPKKE